HRLVAAIAEDLHAIGRKEDADRIAAVGALGTDVDLLDLLGHLQGQGDADAQRDEPSDKPHDYFLLHASAAAPVVRQRPPVAAVSPLYAWLWRGRKGPVSK